LSNLLSSQELAAFFQNLLSCPPCETGKRLCSERSLAERLKIRRKSVQLAFDLLVEEKILVRRHGSGTFVRKVPPPPSGKVIAKVNGRAISVNEMFAEAAKAPIRRQMLDQHKRLRLSLFLSEKWGGETAYSAMEGIKARARQTGHILKIYTVNEQGAVDFDAGAILRGKPFDGCLFWDISPEIASKICGGEPSNVVFFGASSREMDLLCEPIVRLNLEDAITRGVQRLNEQGFRRIALIGHESSRRSSSELLVYEKAMASLKLKYRAAFFCILDDASVACEVKKLFCSRNPPEAVYVSDDIVLRHLVRAWKGIKIFPGENLGVVTLSNQNNPLPVGYDWSQMQFNPFQIGRSVLDSLLLKIQAAGESICSFEHLASWKPGATHLK